MVEMFSHDRRRVAWLQLAIPNIVVIRDRLNAHSRTEMALPLAVAGLDLIAGPIVGMGNKLPQHCGTAALLTFPLLAYPNGVGG